MTEQEARAAVSALVDMRATNRLNALAAMVIDENSRQNLIAASTIPVIWTRHIWDSIQLLTWLPALTSTWLDIGTGGGFPGLAIACAIDMPVTLIEPRRRRADFLAQAAEKLGLLHVKVEARKVEKIDATADVISARAVASVENLLRSAAHCATSSARWLLPRGRSVDEDLAGLQCRWEGLFHVEQSLSDKDGAILICDGISAR